VRARVRVLRRWNAARRPDHLVILGTERCLTVGACRHELVGAAVAEDHLVMEPRREVAPVMFEWQRSAAGGPEFAPRRWGVRRGVVARARRVAVTGGAWCKWCVERLATLQVGGAVMRCRARRWVRVARRGARGRGRRWRRWRVRRRSRRPRRVWV